MKGIEVVWLSKTDLTNLNSGEGESNLIDVKKFKKNGVEYPYVSGQAMRYYIKEAIRRNLSDDEFMCVPDEKGEACGNPKDCIVCDLFGFMKTVRDKGATTRISPVKVSPAIGLLPFDENSTVDFLTRRHRGTEKVEGDIVNVEIGVNIYKVGIAIDVQRVGGEEEIGDDRSVKIKYFVDDNERKNRIAKVLSGLRFLSDYSKQARLLTDFTPDFIIIAFQKIYSHRLQKAVEFNGGLDVERLKTILGDVMEYSQKIFVGLIPKLLENEDEVKKAIEEIDLEVTTPNQAIKSALEYLEKECNL